MKKRIYIKQETADIFCGTYNGRAFNAYIVQNHKTVRRPSTAVREMLAKRRKAEKRGRLLKSIIGGTYAVTLLIAGLTAASLFELPAMSAMEMVRAIACIVWVAVPTSIYIIKKS